MLKKLASQKEMISSSPPLFLELRGLIKQKFSKDDLKRQLVKILTDYFISSGGSVKKTERLFLEKNLTAVFLPYLLNSSSKKQPYNLKKIQLYCSALSVFSLQEIRRFSVKKILQFFSLDAQHFLPDRLGLSKSALKKLETSLKTSNNLWAKKLLFLASFNRQQFSPLYLKLASSLIDNSEFSFDSTGQLLVDLLPEVTQQLSSVEDFMLLFYLEHLMLIAVSDRQLLATINSKGSDSFSLMTLFLSSQKLLREVASTASTNLDQKLSLFSTHLSDKLLALSSAKESVRDASYQMLIEEIANISRYNQQNSNKESLQLAFFGEILKTRIFDTTQKSEWETINTLSRLATIVNHSASSINIERSLPQLSLFSAGINLFAAKDIIKEFNVNYRLLNKMNDLTKASVELLANKSSSPNMAVAAYLDLIKTLINKKVLLTDMRFFEVVGALIAGQPQNADNILKVLSSILKNPGIDSPEQIFMAVEDFRDYLFPKLAVLFKNYPGYQKGVINNVFVSYFEAYNRHYPYFNDIQQNLSEMLSVLILKEDPVDKAGLLALDLFARFSQKHFALVDQTAEIALFHDQLYKLAKIILRTEIAMSPFYEHSIVSMIGEKIFENYLSISCLASDSGESSFKSTSEALFKITSVYLAEKLPENLFSTLNKSVPEIYEFEADYSDLMQTYALFKRKSPSASSWFDEVIFLSLSAWGINPGSLKISRSLLEIIDHQYQLNSFVTAGPWLEEFKSDLLTLDLQDIKQKHSIY